MKDVQPVATLYSNDAPPPCDQSTFIALKLNDGGEAVLHGSVWRGCPVLVRQALAHMHNFEDSALVVARVHKHQVQQVALCRIGRQSHDHLHATLWHALLATVVDCGRRYAGACLTVPVKYADKKWWAWALHRATGPRIISGYGAQAALQAVLNPQDTTVVCRPDQAWRWRFAGFHTVATSLAFAADAAGAASASIHLVIDDADEWIEAKGLALVLAAQLEHATFEHLWLLRLSADAPKGICVDVYAVATNLSSQSIEWRWVHPRPLTQAVQMVQPHKDQVFAPEQWLSLPSDALWSNAVQQHVGAHHPLPDDCVICQDAPVDVLLDCGHSCCAACYRQCVRQMTTRCMFCRQEGALSHLHRYYPLEAQWRNDTLARWAAAGATIAFLDPGAKLPSGFVVYVTAQGHYVARNAWQARDALQKQCVKWACTAAAVPPWFKSMVAVCKQ